MVYVRGVRPRLGRGLLGLVFFVSACGVPDASLTTLGSTTTSTGEAASSTASSVESTSTQVTIPEATTTTSTSTTTTAASASTTIPPLDTWGRITGTVVDEATGEGIVSEIIVVHAATGEPGDPELILARFDASDPGSFFISAPPGDYLLCFVHSDFWEECWRSTRIPPLDWSGAPEVDPDNPPAHPPRYWPPGDYAGDVIHLPPRGEVDGVDMTLTSR